MSCMGVSSTTLKKLFALSGNECAFPDCSERVIDTEHQTVLVQICHIHARNPKGPRYKRDLTPEQRDGFDNLVLFCTKHHKIVDDNPEKFPPETLRQFKEVHEDKFKHSDWRTQFTLEMILKNLNALTKAHPDFDFDIAMSTKDGTQCVKATRKEESIRVSFRFKKKEEKVVEFLDYATGKKKFMKPTTFTPEEVSGIKVLPESLGFSDVEFDHMTITPTYMDSEKQVRIEIPGSSYMKDNVSIRPLMIDGDEITIETTNLPYVLTFTLKKGEESGTVNISVTMPNRPIYECLDTITFLKELNSLKNIVVRFVPENKILLSANIDLDQFVVVNEYEERIVQALAYIERAKGMSYTFPEKITEEDYDRALFVEELLKNGSSDRPLNNLRMSATLEGAKTMMADYDKNSQIANIETTNSDFKVLVFGQYVEIGDIKIKYPPMTIANVAEAKKQIEAEEKEVEIVIEPVSYPRITISLDK